VGGRNPPAFAASLVGTPGIGLSDCPDPDPMAVQDFSGRLLVMGGADSSSGLVSVERPGRTTLDHILSVA